jgi:lytic murein transglycosylase
MMVANKWSRGVYDVRFLPLFLALALFPAAARAEQQCGGDFGAWKAAVEKDASAEGVGQRGVSALAQANFNPEVVRRDHAQGVFTQTFIEFSTRMESAYRLTHGEANLKKYASVFQAAEQRFGVPGPVIAAFWALETDFGAVQGNFSTLDALATLAHDCRRPDLFRPQLIALLKLIDNGTVPADVRGAWAGEIGQTQILPKDYLAQGTDGDGDGRVDLRGSAADVIMTTGHFLQSLGWKAGEPWMEEVRIPDNLPWDETGRENKLPVSQWASWGVTARDGGGLDETNSPASLVLPMGRNGPAFLVFDNFDVYLKWNQSSVYTLTAAHLATRLAGAPAYDRRNPDPGLSPAEMRELQTRLDAKGHDVGKVDGVLGSGTREAVRTMQKQLGLPVDGWPTRKLLDML